MKKILLICEAYGGGAKKYIDTIYSKGAQLNCEFTVLVSPRHTVEGINRRYIVDDNLSFGVSIIKFLKSLMQIDRIVKSKDIDIIHANSSLAGVLIYFYSFLNRGINVVYTPHGYYSFKPMSRIKRIFVRKIERKINSKCKKVIHVSKSEELEAINNKLVGTDTSIVINNGVKGPEENLYQEKKDNNITTILNLARVDDQKNPFEFINIAKKVLKSDANVKFVWAGSGQYLKDIRTQIELEGLQDKISFIGYVSHKAALLQKADIYLSTSSYEGMPFSVIEAMSYGVPLILSDVVGNHDLVINYENGFLYNIGDSNKASSLIISLIQNKDFLKKMSVCSFRRYKVDFSLSNMLKKINKVYGSLDRPLSGSATIMLR